MPTAKDSVRVHFAEFHFNESFSSVQRIILTQMSQGNLHRQNCDFVCWQKSLANAKVSVRQQCVHEGHCRRKVLQINARNIRLKSMFIGLQVYTLLLIIRDYLHLFSSCWFPNLRNSPKIRTCSSSRSHKGHRSGCQTKAHVTFYYSLIVTLYVYPTVIKTLKHFAPK